MSIPAHLQIANDQVGKLHDGQDVVVMSQALGNALPAERSYWAQAKTTTPWCGVFVRWCLWRAGIVVGGPDPDGIGPMWVDWWEDVGTAVPVDQRQPGDIAIYLGNPHHVTFVGDQDDYIGGNQSDGVTRAHYRVPDRVRRPPLPTTQPQQALQSGNRFPGIMATEFGGSNDPNTSAYDNHPITDQELGVALPARFKGTRPKVRVFKDGHSVVCDIVDVGPWNISDPYWETGARPQAESGTDRTGRTTNRAGIDLTPAAANAIGLNGKGVVDWEFVSENTMTDPAPTANPPAVIAPQNDMMKMIMAGLMQAVVADVQAHPEKLQAIFGKLLGGIVPPVTPTAPPATDPTPTAPVTPTVPALPKWGFGTGIIGTALAAILHQQGVTAPPVGDGATLASLVSFILPMALSAFGAGGGVAGIIAKIAPSVFAALTQAKKS